MNRNQFVLSAAALFVSSVASASPPYPLVFQDELKLKEAPPCAICHQGAPGTGTVKTELGRALVSRGLVGGSNEPSLRTAIKALVAEGNPAIKPYLGGGNAALDVVSGPEYGCAFGSVTRGGSAWAASLGVGVMIALARRRRS